LLGRPVVSNVHCASAVPCRPDDASRGALTFSRQVAYATCADPVHLENRSPTPTLGLHAFSKASPDFLSQNGAAEPRAGTFQLPARRDRAGSSGPCTAGSALPSVPAR